MIRRRRARRPRAGTETLGILDGTEQCPFCLQTYAYQLEVRCTACDRAACPFCVVAGRGRRERLCVGCAGPER